MWHVRSLVTAIAVLLVTGVPQVQAASPVSSGSHAMNSPAVMVPLAGNNSVDGYTRKDDSWTYYGRERYHTSTSDITFQPNNLSSGGVCIRLYDETHRR